VQALHDYSVEAMPKLQKDRKKKLESESITFRIEKPTLDDLRQEAGQKMESVNTLVNQIIKSYVHWHRPAKNAGLGYFSKVLMADLIDYLDDDQVIKMTKEYCNHRLKDITHMLKSESTFSSFMEGLCSWLELSGYRYRVDTLNGADTYVIQFDMGRKWSLYFKTQMELVFEQYDIQNAEAEMTDNAVIIRIKRE
jgi:hypothetical protein